jgi:predicted RNA-binding protein with PIN domain
VTTLIVDGYNIIHAWPALKAALARGPLEESRRLLLQRLAEYGAVTPGRVIVVFDGPRRPNLPASPAEMIDGVEVHFSGRSGSADHLIERLAYEATRAAGAEAVCVATSDRLQRDMVRAMGCQTIDARTLEAEVSAALTATAGDAIRLRDQASSQRRLEHQLPQDVYDQLEAIRRGETPPEE